MRPRDRLVIPLAVLIGLVWAGCAVDGIWKGDWVGFSIATSVMVFVASFVFGVGLARRIVGEAGVDER